MQSRSFSWMAALLLLVWLIFVCLIARGATATLPPPLPSPAPIPPPSPLRTVPVPEPDQLDQFVADRAAAIRLGKALFWDMQVGSDGIQSCGSCHFHAGADSRTKNQLNPDLNGSNPAFASPGGPNYTLMAQDFPFHRLANPEDLTSVVADRQDVTGVSVAGCRFHTASRASYQRHLRITFLSYRPAGRRGGPLSSFPVPTIKAHSNVRIAGAGSRQTCVELRITTRDDVEKPRHGHSHYSP